MGPDYTLEPPLIIPLEQSLAIQAWIAEGVDRAADALMDGHAFDTEITVLETRCYALCDFASEGLPGGDDLVAGVMRAFRGRLAGAALLSMDPEEALAWVLSDGSGERPIETYVELGGCVMAAVAEAAGEALEEDVELGEARLEESSIAGCLLRTHAPSDTLLVSSLLEVRAGGQRFAAQLHLVMEPMVISALRGARAVSLHCREPARAPWRAVTGPSTRHDSRWLVVLRGRLSRRSTGRAAG